MSLSATFYKLYLFNPVLCLEFISTVTLTVAFIKKCMQQQNGIYPIWCLTFNTLLLVVITWKRLCINLQNLIITLVTPQCHAMSLGVWHFNHLFNCLLFHFNHLFSCLLIHFTLTPAVLSF